jgi:hypothetical protein
MLIVLSFAVGRNVLALPPQRNQIGIQETGRPHGFVLTAAPASHAA